tara:strand:- start:469 stop:708 length:240 start_codon:yes stop_codon:yes gene_type:complete
MAISNPTKDIVNTIFSLPTIPKKQEKSDNSGMMSPLTKRKNVNSQKPKMQNEPIYKMVKLQQDIKEIRLQIKEAKNANV